MVTARPLGLIIVENSASRADSKWLTRIGSPALSGTITRCPTGLSDLSEPSSSTLMNDSVTNWVGISLTAIMSWSSSVPSGTSTLAQSTFTVCHLSLILRSLLLMESQATTPAQRPSASAMRSGFLPDSKGGLQVESTGYARCRGPRKPPNAVSVFGGFRGRLRLRRVAQRAGCRVKSRIFGGVELDQLVAHLDGLCELAGRRQALDGVGQVPGGRGGVRARGVAMEGCGAAVEAGRERVVARVAGFLRALLDRLRALRVGAGHVARQAHRRGSRTGDGHDLLARGNLRLAHD